jgi:hypothetical protein
MKFRRTSSHPHVVIVEHCSAGGWAVDTRQHKQEHSFWHRVAKQMSWSVQWRRLLAFFCGGSEPTIKQVRDRQGNVYFVGFDHQSGTWTNAMTESETRTWIEERYYR